MHHVLLFTVYSRVAQALGMTQELESLAVFGSILKLLRILFVEAIHHLPITSILVIIELLFYITFKSTAYTPFPSYMPKVFSSFVYFLQPRP